MSTERLERLAAAIESELDGWMLDCCLAFGSTARDEVVGNSDVDLWFVGHAPARIYLDRTWREARFATGLDEFLAEHSEYEVIDIDTWGEIQPKVGLAAPFVFGSLLPTLGGCYGSWQRNETGSFSSSWQHRTHGSIAVDSSRLSARSCGGNCRFTFTLITG